MTNEKYAILKILFVSFCTHLCVNTRVSHFPLCNKSFQVVKLLGRKLEGDTPVRHVTLMVFRRNEILLFIELKIFDCVE